MVASYMPYAIRPQLEGEVLLHEPRGLFGVRIVKLTQSEVANRLGRPQSYVSKCESGERRIDIVELSAFANLYGKRLEFFVPARTGRSPRRG